MEVCCEEEVQCCPIVPRIVKNKQVPACDTFGPFPDETVLSSIDRVLYTIGACSLPSFPNLSMPSPYCTTNSSLGSCASDTCTCCTTTTERTCPSSPLRTITVKKMGCCPKSSCSSVCCSKKSSQTGCTKTRCTRPCCTKVCSKTCCSQACCSTTCKTCCTKSCPKACCTTECTPKSCCKIIRRRIIPTKACCCTNCSPKPNNKCPSRSNVSSNSIPSCCDPPKFRIPLLKRSFSLCSLACRKLKQKLSAQNGNGDSPKWLWTRMQSLDEGVEVYEIFMRSNLSENPSHACDNLNPKMIFVTLSNGTIVPFETLTCHK